MNDTGKDPESVDYRRSVNVGSPTGAKGLPHACACGEPVVFVVTMTQPLVMAMTWSVCAECMPGMNLAIERLAGANRLRVFSVVAVA